MGNHFYWVCSPGLSGSCPCRNQEQGRPRAEFNTSLFCIWTIKADHPPTESGPCWRPTPWGCSGFQCLSRAPLPLPIQLEPLMPAPRWQFLWGLLHQQGPVLSPTRSCLWFRPIQTNQCRPLSPMLPYPRACSSHSLPALLALVAVLQPQSC